MEERTCSGMVVNDYEHWPMLLGFATIGERRVLPLGPSVGIFVSLLPALI